MILVGIGVLAALLLAATTEPRDLLTGLTRLRLPRQLVEIMGFMVRYVEVVTGDLRRMSIALASRGFDARSPRQWFYSLACDLRSPRPGSPDRARF